MGESNIEGSPLGTGVGGVLVAVMMGKDITVGLLLGSLVGSQLGLLI